MTPTSEHPPRTLHIRLSLTGDEAADAQRLDALMRLLETYPGDDPFYLEITNASETVRVGFPNRTTRYCPELVAALRQLLGEDALNVERA
ncbi:MAG TPA: hypothetical protein EYH29_05765 [Caldilineales bacterium]|nr:hypothetical protein [Caldilineales bacterium]